MNSNPVLTESGRAKATKEGKLTKVIESQTSQIPSAFFLALAGGAVAISLGLALSKEKRGWANFVGQWVPTILMLGIYNKIVKTHGSDKTENQPMLH